MTRSRRPLTRSALAASLVVTLGAGSLAACGDDEAADTTTSSVAEATTSSSVVAEPTVSDPWVRPIPDLAAAERTAVYMQITGGSEDDALVSASVPEDVAGTVEVHETVAAEGSAGVMGGDGSGMESTSTMAGSGMMTMQEVERIEIPAGEQVSLEPGGYHIMLMDLTAPLVVGDTVEVTLSFEDAGDVVVTAEVREP